jgi:hypothetical protein
LIVDLRSSFRLGPESLAKPKKKFKTVAPAQIVYLRSIQEQKNKKAKTEALRRGVKFTRVFVHTPDTLRGFVDILEQQQSLGIDVYVAFPDNVPVELCEDYLIVDDKIFAKLELTNDGRAREQRISIDTVEIERMTKRFDTLLRYSRKIDEMAESLKQ